MTRVMATVSDPKTPLPPITSSKRGEMIDIPAPNYTKLSEKLRKSTNQQLLCNMFCGGRKCKYECSDNWSEHEKALPGIFSHWVTEDIIAMARPNTEMIEKFDLIQCFHKNNIRSIINLQEPGEHSSCGNGLTTNGFSYDPTLFMENKVYFYNFQWKDYSIVSDEVLLDMVKVLTFALTEGKVAVHCHAGLGRTGVLIASYLVFAFRCKPPDAIRFVRSKRPNSIQTRGQIMSVMQFSQYVVPFFVIYQHIIHRQMGLTLAQILHRQRLLLHGYELRHLKYIPKIIFAICERLLKLLGRHKVYSPGIIKATNSSLREEIAINFQLDKSESFCKYFFSSATYAELIRRQRPESNNTIALTSGIVSPEMYVTELESFHINQSRISTGNSKNNHKIPENNGICVEPIPQLGLPPVEESAISRESNGMSAPMRQISSISLDTPKKSRASSSCSRSSDDPLESSLSESLSSLIESLGYRVLKIDSSQMLYEQEFQLLANNKNNYSTNDTIDDDYYNDDNDSIDAQCSSGFISTNCGNSEDEDYETVDEITVIKALLADYLVYNKPFKHNLLIYQKEVNTKPSVWEKLSHETNVEMLCALMWSWIESLVEPILTKNSLCYIVIKAEKPLEALIKLDQPIRYTIEYLLRFIGRLNPDEENRNILLRHLMARLTKQRFKLMDGTLVPEGRDWPEMRKGTAGRIMLFTNGIYAILTTN